MVSPFQKLPHSRTLLHARGIYIEADLDCAISVSISKRHLVNFKVVQRGSAFVTPKFLLWSIVHSPNIYQLRIAIGVLHYLALLSVFINEEK